MDFWINVVYWIMGLFIGYLLFGIGSCFVLFGIAKYKGFLTDNITPIEILEKLSSKENTK